MTVNDGEISTILKSAYEKLEKNGIDRTSLKKIINSCNEITQTPTRDDPKVMNDIIDQTLGTVMSSERRQIIYDKLLDDKVTLNL